MEAIKFALRAAQTIREPGQIVDYPHDWGLDDDAIWAQSVFHRPPTA